MSPGRLGSCQSWTWGRVLSICHLAWKYSRRPTSTAVCSRAFAKGVAALLFRSKASWNITGSLGFSSISECWSSPQYVRVSLLLDLFCFVGFEVHCKFWTIWLQMSMQIHSLQVLVVRHHLAKIYSYNLIVVGGSVVVTVDLVFTEGLFLIFFFVWWGCI